MFKDRQVYDPVRKKWTVATPEEVIRQKWIEVMIEHLGFPIAQLVVEKKINQLPHLKSLSRSLPNRRIDLLAYYLEEGGEMKPLLLIECKAIALNISALRQMMGYQSLISCPFMAIANEEEIRVGYWYKEKLSEIPFLPDYRQLKQLAESKSMISADHFRGV